MRSTSRRCDASSGERRLEPACHVSGGLALVRAELVPRPGDDDDVDERIPRRDPLKDREGSENRV